MSDNFFDIIKDVTLDEIIDIFKNHIIAESKIDNNNYMKFINFKYPAYFVKRFSSRAITNKIYEFILMNTKRRSINLDDTKINYLELVIFYEKYYEENIIKIVDVSNNNITGLLFPIINRKNMNNVKKRDTMGLFNVIGTYEENNNYKGIYYDENGNKDYEGEFKDCKFNKCRYSEEEVEEVEEIEEVEDEDEDEVEEVDENKNKKKISYYANGKKRYEGEFEDGKENGKGIYYYENGNKMYEGDVVNNNYNGEGILYHNNGNKKFIGTFKDNLPYHRGNYLNYDGTFGCFYTLENPDYINLPS